ncbi:hypothetical protein BKA57DRAFT_504338 [Linnemannia elongata]|nr:hypothetical protein BKA57DRAFT_504338 [Linnemannia elongata]
MFTLLSHSDYIRFLEAIVLVFLVLAVDRSSTTASHCPGRAGSSSFPDDSSDSNSESTLYHSKTSSTRTPTTPHIVERPRRQRQEVDYNLAGSNRLSMQRSDQQLNVKVLQNCHSQRPQYQQDHELDDVKEQPQEAI